MRGMGYPMPLVSEARRLGRAGWTGVDIQGIMRSEHGVEIPHRTVSRWLNDESAEADRVRNKERKRVQNAAAASFQLKGSSPAYQQAFVKRLRGEGVPSTSIAKVCSVVFGEPWSRDRVRAVLGMR